MPVTIISGVRAASSIPSVQCSAAPSFALATVSFGSAAAAGAAAISDSAQASDGRLFARRSMAAPSQAAGRARSTGARTGSRSEAAEA